MNTVLEVYLFYVCDYFICFFCKKATFKWRYIVVILSHLPVFPDRAEEFIWRQDTQRNNTQHNGTKTNKSQNKETQSNKISTTTLGKMKHSLTILSIECHYAVSLCWVSLCWVSLCWVSLCWVSLCWVSLSSASLCRVP